MCFSIHKLEFFSSNPVKLYFHVLVHFFRYIRDNKNFGLEYYAKIYDVPLSGILRQAIIDSKNQLVSLSYYICQDFLYTGIIIGSYIMIYQGGTIDHFTHVLGLVSQSSVESEYNEACTAGISSAHFIIIDN